ncbi:hypothetical protein CHI12_11180 [Terribacillus saccharophilus]|uniref:DNA-binding response regulator n=1 Tax=Terribacillus saccharophilus TaxID=361277 RepID=A0A268HC71_9BACI|nr:response regulator transcription factor [Terribacillus saccharophilus]PAE07461.1 hypothetical protein CHI12_11180 [Terribacillus saccharophilus]
MKPVLRDIKIIIINRHRSYREGLHFYLNQQEGFYVPYSASSSQNIIHKIKKHNSQIILVDIEIMKKDYPTSIENFTVPLLDKYPNLKILFHTTTNLPHYNKLSFEAGVKGIVTKNNSLQEISTIIKSVNEGMTFFPTFEHNTLLTDNEIQILKNIGEGKTNKEIAHRLYYSTRTVEHYVTTIFNKFEVSSRLQAVLKGIKLGYISNFPD